MISPDDYEAMLKAEKLEDKFLEKLAIEAREEGYLSEDESRKLLDSMLSALWEDDRIISHTNYIDRLYINNRFSPKIAVL